MSIIAHEEGSRERQDMSNLGGSSSSSSGAVPGAGIDGHGFPNLSLTRGPHDLASCMLLQALVYKATGNHDAGSPAMDLSGTGKQKTDLEEVGGEGPKRKKYLL
ncbi:hypothetical protein ElyMa_002951500 [Elysia marginata]|uniref:Uncharacterized protein n=1 Tax=Elysia marginata TaxID=1093978 RepID=A0AAV4IA79_9GAST|nr:hypothetical protein ElyMa_002951500 [Elysia marginata]